MQLTACYSIFLHNRVNVRAEASIYKFTTICATQKSAFSHLLFKVAKTRFLLKSNNIRNFDIMYILSCYTDNFLQEVSIKKHF